MASLPSVATTLPATSVPEQPVSPLEKLSKFLDGHHLKGRTGPQQFEQFEQQLHEKIMEFQREVLARELDSADINEPAIEIDGKVYRRALRQNKTYMTAAGEVEVMRTLYRNRQDDDSRCVCPLEMTLGIIDGFWTPQAAKQAEWVVTQLTPQKSEDLFERIGNMGPSKSSIDRLAKLLSSRWEQGREGFEEALREGFTIPEGTVSITVSLDGVHIPCEASCQVTPAREADTSEEPGANTKACYREASCGCIALCDKNGNLLGAIRMARAPESKKETLKQTLAAEVKAIKARYPEITINKVADGARDNWDFLESDAMPEGPASVDFFHAQHHLNDAIVEAYGQGTSESREIRQILSETLRDEVGGVEVVIAELADLAARHPKSKVIQRELGYFCNNRDRMHYAEMQDRCLMIGSGLVEAACKTLVTQRLKQSGMYWSLPGAQAVLTPRGWDQSERFDRAWALLAATFHTEVTILAHVIPFNRGARCTK